LKGVVDLYAAEELRILTATLLLHRVTSKVSSKLASKQYNVGQFENDVDKQDYLKCFKSIALCRPVDGTVTDKKAFKMILDCLDDEKINVPMMSVNISKTILNMGLDLDTRVCFLRLEFEGKIEMDKLDVILKEQSKTNYDVEKKQSKTNYNVAKEDPITRYSLIEYIKHIAKLVTPKMLDIDKVQAVLFRHALLPLLEALRGTDKVLYELYKIELDKLYLLGT
jgi:hypothetical protein